MSALLSGVTQNYGRLPPRHLLAATWASSRDLRQMGLVSVKLHLVTLIRELFADSGKETRLITRSVPTWWKTGFGGVCT